MQQRSWISKFYATIGSATIPRIAPDALNYSVAGAIRQKHIIAFVLFSAQVFF
ncbi:hypothetical protein D1BOALGB6SA_3291 [Olavius sp. associated proteobacterium Delta 1]|nr:hypothetical protein D1BOALGB6SA_3291 [Olavius sp. associated proteobacterium Delta 1]